ncbi:MAG: TIM-barrel domain-containing protein, partial [Phycisphaerae bacterium]
MARVDRRKFIGCSAIAAVLMMESGLRASSAPPGEAGRNQMLEPAGLGNVVGYRVEGNAVTLSIGESQLTYRVLSAGLIRVDYNLQGKVDPPTPVLDSSAHWPAMVGASITHDDKIISIETTGFYLKISQAPCRMSLSDSRGKLLLEEPVGGGIYIDPADTRLGGLRFLHTPGRHFYGIKAYPSMGPESHDTSLLRCGRGDYPEVYQCDASWGGGGGAPFLWTTDGYGVLVDSDGGFFAVGENNLGFSYGYPGHPVKTTVNSKSKSTPTAGYAWRSRTVAPCLYPRPNSLTYFLIIGTPTDIFSSLAELTGRATMFPRWATGFTNSQWGINQYELIDIVDGYRARNIPIDNFAIDFDWKSWGENNFGEFRWNEKKFPAALLPPTHFDNFKNIMDRRQIRLTGIMKPRIIRCTSPGKLVPMTTQALSALKAGVWYPGQTQMVDYVHQQYAVLINFNLPDGRRWYWQQTRRHGAMDGGLSGFWNDEADGFNNFFFMHMQQSLYEGERSRSDLRVWSINRNFYLGSQRYAYGTWSGDIAPGFKSMAHQALRMLSMISLGQARWSMDAGNWGPPTPEAYTRWLQFAAFVPIFRVHAPHENSRLQPWLYGFRAQEIAVHAIRLRYSLSPYIYALDRG